MYARQVTSALGAAAAAVAAAKVPSQASCFQLTTTTTHDQSTNSIVSKTVHVRPGLPAPTQAPAPAPAAPSKPKALPLTELTAVSPIDGRYASKVSGLREIFSEYGLMKYRVQVEVAWLLEMSEHKDIPEVAKLSSGARKALVDIAATFDVEGAKRVKAHERVTNHDVKAIEYYIKEEMQKNEELTKIMEFTHFCCTSEDINNLSYGLMCRDAVQQVVLPKMRALVKQIEDLAEEHANVPMLALTHGQPATPTTFGKECAIVAWRLNRQVKAMERLQFMGKFNGASGNFNAHIVAYPKLDWPAVSQHLVEDRLGLTYQPYSTQIEVHDWIAEMCDTISRFNIILLDFDRDMWQYVSLNRLKLKTVAGEVGSSTMPHKVNPIQFENSEGNVGVANALLNHFSAKLPVCRMQRDLSDSTVLRCIGMGVAHTVLAIDSTLGALSRVTVNPVQMEKELGEQWAVLAEAVQTNMRKASCDKPYEQLKALTRGQEVNEAVMSKFVADIKPQFSKQADAGDWARLTKLTPGSYVGLAAELARGVRAANAACR
mmetsp:Transcript_22927/g.55504  ORF Transcript_22927/g.55504 Transcript_22927/m.55504 type:complete len:545 (+) Transcript_22927:34-1668(+)